MSAMIKLLRDLLAILSGVAGVVIVHERRQHITKARAARARPLVMEQMVGVMRDVDRI